MVEFLKTLFRHFRLPVLGSLLVANVFCGLLFLGSLVGPVLLASQPGWGMAVLLGGFFLTGQALAVSGRLLDRRFQGGKPAKGGLVAAWFQAWAEGLVVAAVLIGLFSLAFNSVPFYWAQGTAFSVFSLLTLGAGTVLILGGLPYYLPVRRREGLGLLASAARSFKLMNSRPGLALTAATLGLVALAATVGSGGLIPGLGGLAAFHQGVYDTATEEKPR
jgi:hypothetical protein